MTQLRYEDLYEYDVEVKKQIENAIYEYEGFRKAVISKMEWKIADWRKLDLSFFYQGFNEAMDRLEYDIDNRVLEAADKLFTANRKLLFNSLILTSIYGN